MSEAKFQQVISNYIHKLSSLQETTPLLMFISYAAREATNKKKGEFLDEFGVLTQDEGETKQYTVDLPHISKLRSLDKKRKRAETAYEALPRTFLVSLVSGYDAFLGHLIREIFEVKPKLLNASEKNISFSDLQSLGSIDAARENLIEREIESILRKSHSDQFKWLEQKLGIELRKELDVWSTFVELTERRNLFVHCDGVVSSQYLKVCRDNKVDSDELSDVGDQLQVSRDYLTKSYECLFEIAVKLTQVIARKLLPDQLEQADEGLNLITYDLLLEEKYGLASILLDFACSTLKKWSTDSSKRMFVMNRAQAYYYKGDKQKCQEILGAEDWSACADQFQICNYVLQDDFDSAFSLMKKMGSNGPISDHFYLEWPVFKEFRAQDEFPEVYEKIFGVKPLDYTEFEESGKNQSNKSSQEDASHTGAPA